MAIDQTHIDDIILAASSDDPAVRFQNLEREVDLLKITIKRLLMDIRERMNELENPLTLVCSGTTDGRKISNDLEFEARNSAQNAREAALNARETLLEMESPEQETVPDTGISSDIAKTVFPAVTATSDVNREFFTARTTEREVISASEENEGNLPLQKMYHLFCWTERGVKKFGHTQFEALVQSYNVLGYISTRHSGAINQIAALMPVSPDELSGIGPYQFIEEMYLLNRILSPGDTSLDRDMIEVMMEQRRQESDARNAPTIVMEEFGERSRTRAGAGISDYRDSDLHRMNLKA